LYKGLLIFANAAPAGAQWPPSRQMDGNVAGINAFFALNYALPVMAF
jgi:hypothetical protein